MEERVMILAAGMGTRLVPLTDEIPKPMVPVVNLPVMEHLIRLLASGGFREVVVNLHYMAETIESHFGDGSRWGLDIRYSHEDLLLGTAGGVKKCEGFLKGNTFLVVSGDALTDVDLRVMLDFHRQRKALATVMVTTVSEVTKYGVALADEGGRICGFQEKPSEAEALSNLANSGIYVLEPEVFERIPSGGPYDFGRELFPEMVRAGEPIYAWRHDRYWNDVGSIEEYQRGNFDALNGRVKVEIPGLQVSPGVWIGRGTRLHRNVLITPPVCIGDRCEIEEGARLIGPVVVGPDTVVRPGAVLYRGIKWGGGYIGQDASVLGSIVGADATVGSGAVVLDGSVVGSRAVVRDGIVIDSSVKIASGSVVESGNQPDG